ncbi:MAG TPA: TIGR03435 family protein [Bryobacteraceae bacterium]|nr:TIGR03435 family protein [Bryobacteraceae bacterium]
MTRMLIAVLLASAALAQPAFEVASVKPADRNARILDLREEPGGRLTIKNISLLRIVQWAYGMHWYWIAGGPSWIDSDRFDILAKAEGDPSHEQMMNMLATLLEDRFKLKLHRETKEGAVFHLVVAKSGAKLTPSKDKNADSRVLGRFNALTHRLMGENATMDQLRRRLEDELHQPVIDQTGLEGNFDFSFEYSIDDSKPESGPSLVTAIQELGLRLESAGGPVETLVIDHAEKPGEN